MARVRYDLCTLPGRGFEGFTAKELRIVEMQLDTFSEAAFTVAEGARNLGKRGNALHDDLMGRY